MIEDETGASAEPSRGAAGRLGLRAGATGIRLLSRLRTETAIAPRPPTDVLEFDGTIETKHRTPVEAFAPYRDSSGGSRGLDEPLPVYLNFHGGGFVLGDPDMDSAACRWLASAVECVVVNVEYALAPENPFPAAVEECVDLVATLSEASRGTLTDARTGTTLEIDQNRIAVGGQSAGGNIAAALALVARERGIPLACQVLNYPPLDLARDHETRPHERDEVLSPRIGCFFNACYLSSGTDPSNPLVSPVYADDLSALAPALVITAEHDMLRPDGEEYVELLADAGVDVAHREFEDCQHGFTHRGSRERAVEAWELVAERLRETFFEP